MSKEIYEIEKPYCKFETAKLLKDVGGFQVACDSYFEYALTSKKDEEDGYGGPFGWKKGELNLTSGYFRNGSESDRSNTSWYLCAAPEQWKVVKWLKLMYDIDITYIHFTEQPMNGEVWKDAYQAFVGGEAIHPYGKTPEEVIEYAILYILKNRI